MTFSALVAACAADMPVEPPGTGVKVETQIIKVPDGTRCDGKEKLGPEPTYAANPSAVRDVPHKTLSEDKGVAHRQKEENWLHVTKLMVVQIDQLFRRLAEYTAAYSAC
jgi:hypothetical protein